MTVAITLARLQDVADLNPSLGALPADDESVSFLPMSALAPEVVDAVDTETRPFKEVSKGYTPFIANDVLVAKITPCFENGKVAQAKPTRRVGFGSTEFHVIRTHTTKLHPRYLVHFLRQECIRKDGEQRMTGSAGQRRVPEHFLANLRIPVPPLPEQRRIAEILDKADALRAKRRAALVQLDALTQSIFLAMFGDPAKNPKKWVEKTLGELIASGPQNGIYKPASAYGSGTPIVRIDAFYDGSFTDLQSLKRVQISQEEQVHYCLREGQIVVNRVNSRPYLGKSVVVPGLTEPTVFESNMMRFDVDRRAVVPEYVVQFLQTAFARSQILQAAKDAVNQSSINQQDVRNLRIKVPELFVQQLYAERIKVLARFRLLCVASLNMLDTLFASLQHRAFRGEV